MTEDTRKSKRVVIVFLVALGLGAGYTAWMYFGRSPAESSEPGVYPGTVKVGHLVALDMAPLFVAKEAGFFEDEGIEVETVFFANPGDNNAALSGGSIQFSTNPFTLPFLGDNNGSPMRIVSSAGGLGVIEVVIQGRFGVSNMGEVANWVKTNPGKKLKVGTLRGDTLDMILYKAFRDKSLDYDDFEMVWFNDLLAMVEAFRNAEIDVLSHIKPYTTDLIKNHGAKSITNNNAVWGYGTPNCTVAVMEDFLEKYPETVRRYLRALRRGFQLIVDDPEKAVSLLSKGGYYKVPEDVLLFAFKNQPKDVMLRPNVDGMMTCINDMIKQSYIKKANRDVVQLDLLDEIEKEKKPKK